MNKESSKKKILNKPLLKRKFCDTISNIKTNLLEVLTEDCEEDKENQCQNTSNNIYLSQASSHLTLKIQIDDKFVSKRKRMRNEEVCSDSAQATPLEESTVPAVKQPIKSCITITRIPREKSVNVASNESMDPKRNEPDQNLFKKSDDLNMSMEEPDHLEKKYNLFESENDSLFDESKPKKSKKHDKDLNDNPAPKIVTRSHRSAAQKIPKYVFSEDENSENMSDTGEQKKPKSVFKPKTAVKSRNQATKKSDKKRNLSDDEEKLNLNSARSDQEDAYSVFGEDEKQKSLSKTKKTDKAHHPAAKKPSKAQLKKEKAKLELDAETERELEAIYKEQQELKNYKLIVEVVDRDY